METDIAGIRVGFGSDFLVDAHISHVVQCYRGLFNESGIASNEANTVLCLSQKVWSRRGVKHSLPSVRNLHLGINLLITLLLEFA